ncbi:Dyp-type peroxidase [Chromobacterium alticapitis]|uniref:Peroxidase n=1 Tax=Chromobacterium alticapitis TaxID=2073169 RepID=A0A2S5DD79_9NEIS|nr:Dyp-type peroxidase [Chromobacterium alticapitis]POZ61053.1 hypothetical protein C2I19_15615 [Chromobacterium alticapitis]
MAQPFEPILDGAEIQGDILAGFRKDHVRLLFISVTDVAVPAFKAWIRAIAPKLAYLDAVADFNRKFSTARRASADGRDPPMSVTWMNLAISGQGAKRLLSQDQWSQLDITFLNGPTEDATLVGEPDAGSPGGSRSWLVGAPNQGHDALLIIAGDERAEVDNTAAAHKDELLQLVANVAAVTVRLESGDIRSAQKGHEHFGFKDGISQPGVRGRIGTATGPYVTPRVLDSQDPWYALYAAPGQPLCYPGEFVLGYPRKHEGSDDPNDTVVDPTTPLTKHGSYLVYRRLRQDVPGFIAAAETMAAQLSQNPSFGPRTTAFAAACLVGRWPSGAPVMRTPLADNQKLGDDSYASNNFQFVQASHVPKYSAGSEIPPDDFPQARDDTLGSTCPFSAHIRKVNPRDQTTDQGPATRTLEHRILRRGIPYGVDYDPTKPGSDKEERGLQFLCYQSSIQRGFQFLMNQWANSADFPLGRGYDIVIGQRGEASRSVTVLAPDNSPVSVTFPQRYVVTTGAAYLFSPSKTALLSCFGA